jgi:2-phospho-L-lactate guanylyltransferase (CobY/MobA/RfbA family)
MAAREKTCMVVPDAARRGTNLLIATPPREDIYRFGEFSFSKHQEIAHQLGFNVLVEEDRRIAFDVDEPADYRHWVSMCSHHEEPIQPLSGRGTSHEIA